MLYADDGLLFFKEGQSLEETFLRGNSVFAASGVKFAMEKSGWVSNTIKFLGTEFDLETRTLSNDSGVFAADELTDDRLKDIVGKTYGPIKEKPWIWEIDGDSYLQKIYDPAPGMDAIDY